MQRYPSCLVAYSSSDAVYSSNVYGNGDFKCVINNATNITHAIKVSPNRVVVPNIFPNVGPYVSVGFEFAGTVIPIQLTHGFYSATEFCQMFNAVWQATRAAIMLGDPTFSADMALTVVQSGTSNQSISLTKTGTDNGPLHASVDFWELIGFQSIVSHVPGNTDVNSQIRILDVPETLIWPRTPPHFGGESVVHIDMGEAAPANMVSSSRQGEHRNIMISVPLTKTAYGEYTCYKSADTATDDVDFDGNINLHNVEVKLRDSKMRQLTVPSNYHVLVILKVFHTDEKYGV